MIGTQEVHWLSQSASVRFEVSDVASYKRTIRAVWYYGEIPSNLLTYVKQLDPPDWSEHWDEYHLWSSYGLKGGATCTISMNSAANVVLIRMKGTSYPN